MEGFDWSFQGSDQGRRRDKQDKAADKERAGLLPLDLTPNPLLTLAEDGVHRPVVASTPGENVQVLP